MPVKKSKIVLFGDPVLRKAAKPVTVFHKKLHGLIDSMVETLHDRDDGAALAANQIGVLKSITVIDYMQEYFEMINPEIIDSEGEQTEYEGCLSLPGYFGLVSRYDHIKVKYLDRNGKENIIERNGKLARCFQHEIDHLNGILFIDKVCENFLINNDNDAKISLESVKELADGRKIKPDAELQ
jgi:peptide deformylase